MHREDTQAEHEAEAISCGGLWGEDEVPRKDQPGPVRHRQSQGMGTKYSNEARSQ